MRNPLAVHWLFPAILACMSILALVPAAAATTTVPGQQVTVAPCTTAPAATPPPSAGSGLAWPTWQVGWRWIGRRSRGSRPRWRVSGEAVIAPAA
jgi:hypothetical protein